MRDAGRSGLKAGLATFGLGLAVWLLVWRVTGDLLDWPRVEDDAFYYFQVAVNAGHGHGFTMDQLNATTGFHPLWMFVTIPVFRLVGGATTAGLVAMQIIVLALVATSVGLLVRLLRPRTSWAVIALALVVFAFPAFFNNLANGLESSLMVALLLTLAIVVADGDGPAVRYSPRRAFAVGGLAALIVLSRLDTSFLLVPLAAWVLAGWWTDRAGRSTRSLVTTLAVMVGPAVVALAVWCLCLLAIDGHLLPTSGQVKTSFPVPGLHLDALVGVYLPLLAIGGAGWLASWTRWPSTGARSLRVATGLFTGAAVLHAVFTVLFSQRYLQNWDFESYLPAGLLGLVILADGLRLRLRWAVPVALAGASVLTVAATGLVFASYADANQVSASYDAGRWVAHHLPPDAVLGMSDSGAFTYASHRRVVNLDGVASSSAFVTALCNGHAVDLLRRNHVAYLASAFNPVDVRNGRYTTATIALTCPSDPARSTELTVTKAAEVYRGPPYAPFRVGVADRLGGETQRVMIWRWQP